MTDAYTNLISIENIFQAWSEFQKGKRKKCDVMLFERNLEDNLFDLYKKLKNKTYKHGSYTDFYVTDPKRRHIHKAEVEDRIVHHMLYKYLYELFDKTFIFDSYSCRINKGTHKAVKRLEKYARIVSRNYTINCWTLKLDIKKFFASVDHKILKDLIEKKVTDKNILWLLEEVINSFPLRFRPSCGIPLGNLTSQIFANIYLNELDQFIKHDLMIRYYLRYADDFLILDQKPQTLLHHFESIEYFLKENLKLKLHPKKISLRKLSWGIDYCGYIVLPYYILPRTKTKRRIINKILDSNVTNQSLQSYLGYLSHAYSKRLSHSLVNNFWLTS